MSKTIIVKSPIAGYEIVDFGAGRILARYGHTLVERPVMDPSGQCALAEWSPDWRAP